MTALLEAAIQSAHVDRGRPGNTDWRAIADFYQHLVQLTQAFDNAIGLAEDEAVRLSRLERRNA